MPESLQDLAESSEMLLPSGEEDDNIVKIKQARLPVEAREGGVSVAKTEWDLIKFVHLSTAGTKGGLCSAALHDWHLTIATLEDEG